MADFLVGAWSESDGYHLLGVSGEDQSDQWQVSGQPHSVITGAGVTAVAMQSAPNVTVVARDGATTTLTPPTGMFPMAMCIDQLGTVYVGWRSSSGNFTFERLPLGGERELLFQDNMDDFGIEEPDGTLTLVGIPYGMVADGQRLLLIGDGAYVPQGDWGSFVGGPVMMSANLESKEYEWAKFWDPNASFDMLGSDFWLHLVPGGMVLAGAFTSVAGTDIDRYPSILLFGGSLSEGYDLQWAKAVVPDRFTSMNSVAVNSTGIYVAFYRYLDRIASAFDYEGNKLWDVPAASAGHESWAVAANDSVVVIADRTLLPG